MVNHGPVHYSSLTILSDGTIGCLYENSEFWEEEPGSLKEMEICFARFSLKWLTDGIDSLLSYSPKLSFNPKPITSSEIHDVLVFPNPVEDGLIHVNFVLKKSSYVEVSLLDFMGNEIETLMNNSKLEGRNNTLSFRTSILNRSTGIYFLKIKTENKTVVKKNYL